MSKYTKEFKLKVVKEYLKGNLGYKTLAMKYNIPKHEQIRRWIKRYQEHGIDGLEKNSITYDGNFSKISISSVGNSISTGFSLVYDTKPFLERNIYLKEICEKYKCELKTYSFARPQDNNDEHIFRALVRNMKISQINRKVRIDLSNSKRAMYKCHINDVDKQRYFPINPKDDVGLRDIVENKDKDTANILIYNGLTGAFLDVLTRGGNKLHAFRAFERDLDNFKAFIKYVYLVNPNTQVYVCGIPNILGIGLFNKINKKAKRECFNYPNVTYVDSVKTKFFYLKDGKYHIDIHYDDNEYLKMNINVFNAIYNNYFRNVLFTEFDKILHKYQDNIDESVDDIFKSLHQLTVKYDNLIDVKLYDELIKFYKLRYPFSYYYTPKEGVINFIKLKQKIII